MYGRRDVRSKVLFSFGADPGHERSPRHAHAFITRRGDIGTPPRRSVTMALNGEHVRRPLRFLSFGDALHDELIKGWLPQGDGLVTLNVAFLEDHALWAHGSPRAVSPQAVHPLILQAALMGQWPGRAAA